MSKAFLSHSSFDKDFVESVFNILGTSKAIFDKSTFQRNCDLVEQIERGIKDADTYVLFLSQASLSSGWVSAEIDLAHELRAKWKIKNFLIFQLDDTPWSKLPEWMSRYVVSSPPSPAHVALRIQDQLIHERSASEECHGREDETREIVERILEADHPTNFIYISGPAGIGRKTLANSVYNKLFPDIAGHKITIKVDEYDEIDNIYRKVLAYSSNWRASDYIREASEFSKLNNSEKILKLTEKINEISANYRQVAIFDLGSFALDERGQLLPWLSQVLSALPDSDYPYACFISNRQVQQDDFTNGVVYQLGPLSEKWSKYLFKLLLSQNKIKFPSRAEQDNVERSIIGHPGLITSVVNHLKINPNYKPNKTHNNVVRIIGEQIQAILKDFIIGRRDIEEAVSFIAESYILSYDEIIKISKIWPNFDSAIESLIDSGFLVETNGDYTLAPYLQRYAQTLTTANNETLEKARKILLEEVKELSGETFIPATLLETRIVECIYAGETVSGILRNIIMPSQQLKAAKRKYNEQHYDDSLTLAKEAYSQSAKLSEAGKSEAWRLIGLSACRLGSDEDFLFFEKEYERLSKTTKRDSIYYFAHGFKHRTNGDLRLAFEWFKKIDEIHMSDHHVYREMAYIYAFEGNYDEAIESTTKALKLAPANSYILDILAFALTEKYREKKNQSTLEQLEDCLDELRKSNDKSSDKFHFIRSKIKDIIVYGNSGELLNIYNNRSELPIHAKLALLDLLSKKSKQTQYSQLKTELEKTIREHKNNLAKIELAKIEIENYAFTQQIKLAQETLEKNRRKLTDKSISKLTSTIEFAKAIK